MPVFTCTINRQKRSITAPPDMPLLWVLRDLLQLRGTKYGCGVGVCGACTVHRGGEAVRSCQIPISEADGQTFVTIEGIAPEGLHPLQKAWLEEDVAQCGYCQPGMIMTACALLTKNHHPSEADINAAMSNSVCRCGTYQRMRRAIQRAANGSSRT
jgi:isoquinoline 1-oxidoreductase alpha subunit